MILRRGGRPGLIGLAAQTAAGAGTTADGAGRVDPHQQDPAPAHGDQDQHEVVRQPSGTGPAPGADVLTRLQKLAELKQAGLLTDEEFTAAKAQLLD
jgi:hypothetical protein